MPKSKDDGNAPAPKPSEKLGKLPDGYVWVWAGKLEKDGRTLLEVEDKGHSVMKLYGVETRMPTSSAALAEACAKDTFEFTDVDGVKHEFKGVEASAAKKFVHGSETCRGLGRRKNKAGEYIATAAEVRQAYRDYAGPAGGTRGNFGRITEAQVADLSREELLDLLRRKGTLVSGEAVAK